MEMRESLMEGFREASTALHETLSTLEMDPYLDRVASLIAAAPHSEDVRSVVLETLDASDSSAAPEVIQYLAHRFRWKWLRCETQTRAAGEPDLRRARFYEMVLEAFSEDWGDRDLFPSLMRDDDPAS